MLVRRAGQVRTFYYDRYLRSARDPIFRTLNPFEGTFLFEKRKVRKRKTGLVEISVGIFGDRGPFRGPSIPSYYQRYLKQPELTLISGVKYKLRTTSSTYITPEIRLIV